MARTRLFLVSLLVTLPWTTACGDGSVEPPPEPPNRAPVARGAIPAQTVAVGKTSVVDVSQYFSDPDGDALSYSAETSDAGVATASVAGSVVTLAGVAKGNASVTVTATDPDGLSVVQTFGVTVPNRPPLVADSIAGLELMSGDSATIDLSAHFADPDGDSLSFAAETTDSGVVASSVSETIATVRGVAKGTATATLTATDPEGLSAQQTFGVTVPNQAPLVLDSIRARELKSGDSAIVDVSGHFADPDGDSLRYTAETSNAGVVSATALGSVVTIRALGHGAATVSVTATDPEGSSATLEAMITVRNLPPEAVGAIPPQIVKELRRVTVGLYDHFSDPEGGVLTYSATVSDSALATVATSDTAVAVNGVAEGTVTVVVTATDLGGLSVSQNFEVTEHSTGQHGEP